MDRDNKIILEENGSLGEVNIRAVKDVVKRRLAEFPKCPVLVQVYSQADKETVIRVVDEAKLARDPPPPVDIAPLDQQAGPAYAASIRQVRALHAAGEVTVNGIRASRESWKCKPFISGVPLPFSDTYTREEFDIISYGLIPRAMEDKWFIFLEEDTLYLHRSWTGDPVYKVVFYPDDTHVNVEEARVSTEEEKPTRSFIAYQTELLRWLIGCLLLQKELPFPLPADLASEEPKGLYQHHIAGTACPEIVIRGKPWWRLW